MAAAAASLVATLGGCSGDPPAEATRTHNVTGTPTADRVPSSPPPAGSEVTTGELVRWVSGAKAELVQYQLGLHVACGSQTRQCWAVLRYSSKVGADITADLAQVTTRPPQAIGMWSHTSSAAWALATVAGRWCAPDRDFIGCYRAVVGSAQALSRTLAAWAAYLAKS